MAKSKLLKISHGPLPGAQESCLTLQLLLSSQEVSQVLKSQERLRSTLPWFKASLNPNSSDEVKAGEYIVQLARALLNELGGLIATANCQAMDEGVMLTLGYHQAKIAAQAIAYALGLALAPENLSALGVTQQVEAFWNEARPFTPDPIARVLITEAQKAHLPVRPYHWPSRQWLFGWGTRSESFFEAAPSSDSHAGRKLSSDKQLCKLFATACGFKVLPSQRVANLTDLEKAGKAVGFPCVVKPVQGTQGKGVSTNIPNPNELYKAWKLAQESRPGDVLVEQFAEGEVYRLMVIRGKFVSSIVRPRPSIQADGQSTILQLAEKRNQLLAAGLRPSSYGRPTPLDPLFVDCLRRQGFRPESVPASGRTIYLRDVPLVSKGATGIADVTALTHPDIKAAAIDLSVMLGLDCSGIDLLTADISQPDKSFFLEINGTPEIRVMVLAGMPADEVVRQILGPKPARIPTLLMVTPKDKQGEIALALEQKQGLGWSLAGKAGIGARHLSTELTSCYDHLELLVRNPSVHALSVAIAPEDLVTFGLPLDRWDQIVLTHGASLTPEFTAWLSQQTKTLEIWADLSKLKATIEAL